MHSNHERLSGLSRFFRRPLSVIALAFAGGALISPPLHANEPAPHEHTALHEVDFMQHGMDLHLLSQRMAEACTQRASNAEVLDLCSTMVTAHQDDRMQLQSWLQSWYGNDHEARFSDAQRARLEHLQTLNGNEFERHFLRDMTALHTVMIKDGAMCEAQFYHPELIGYCQEAVTASAEEIHLMRTQLCELYGICDLKMTPNPSLDEPREPSDADGNGAEEDGGGDGQEGDGGTEGNG